MTTEQNAIRGRLRALPSVDQLASALLAQEHGPTKPEATAAARETLRAHRAELLAGTAQTDPDLVALTRERLRPSLRRVLNGTGVIIHTNLGRAPLAAAAAQATADAARGYVNLELDLATGRRSNRDRHVTALLAELTGADDALVVNNGAAATLLATAALAGPGRAIAVSRGQLIEIGGGFRIPDVIAQAGARLIEVGTTNKTRATDYADALSNEHGADVILRVHQSNFRTVGFVEDVPISALTTLGVPVIDDLGSGALDVHIADEPPVRASIEAGCALVCFSGDKLLGGPQAGILVGQTTAIDACRRHPLARALRIGRLPMAALEATLALYRDPEKARQEIPVLAMLEVSDTTLRARAERLAAAAGPTGAIVEAKSRVGGGALPLLELPGPVLAISCPAETLAARLRAGDPPLLPRITDGRVIIDPRTLADDEIELAATALRIALGP